MKNIIGLFMLVSVVMTTPTITWAAGERLNIFLFWMDGQLCEILLPGSGVQQQGHNRVRAADCVRLGIVASTSGYTAYTSEHTVNIKVLDPATLPFLTGAISEATPIAKRSLINIGSVIPQLQGFYGCTLTVYPWRATTHQRGVPSPYGGTTVDPKDILEYRFIVEDTQTPALIPDTSSPLDSVIPGAYTHLLLVLPGEKHYPGDPSSLRVGKKLWPWDWNAGKSYDCWVYATDDYYNAVPFDPGNPEYCSLRVCQSTLVPDTITPKNAILLFDTVRHDNTVLDSVAKKVFKVRYATVGVGGLRAVAKPPSTRQSNCEKVRITGPAPDPKNQIVVIPNPCGTPGLPATITIYRVPISGGEVRGKLYDAFGYLVRDFSKELMDQSTRYPFSPVWEIEWDGTNDKGKKVASGCYQLCVEIIQVERSAVWKEKVGVVW